MLKLCIRHGFGWKFCSFYRLGIFTSCTFGTCQIWAFNVITKPNFAYYIPVHRPNKFSNKIRLILFVWGMYLLVVASGNILSVSEKSLITICLIGFPNEKRSYGWFLPAIHSGICSILLAFSCRIWCFTFSVWGSDPLLPLYGWRNILVHFKESDGIWVQNHLEILTINLIFYYGKRCMLVQQVLSFIMTSGTLSRKGVICLLIACLRNGQEVGQSC